MLGLKHPIRDKQLQLLVFRKQYPVEGAYRPGTYYRGGAQRRSCCPGNNRYETERKLDHRELNKFPEARKLLPNLAADRIPRVSLSSLCRGATRVDDLVGSDSQV